MQPVYRTASYVDAQILKGFLAEHGVDSHVQGGEFGNIMARRLTNPAYRVLVDAPQFERAADLIARWEKGEFALDEDAHIDIPDAPP